MLELEGRICSLDREARHESLKSKVDTFHHFFFIYWDSLKRQDEMADEDGADWAYPGFLVIIQRGSSPGPTWGDYVPQGAGQAGEEGVVSLRPNKSEREKEVFPLNFGFNSTWRLLKAAGTSIRSRWTPHPPSHYLLNQLGLWKKLIKHVKTEHNYLIGCQKSESTKVAYREKWKITV